MKAIVFHGTNGNPDKYWYQWLGEQLKASGYGVEIPSYPMINREPIATFLPKVLQDHTFDEKTVLIGHSAGAALILSILQYTDAIIPLVILVAGYATIIEGDSEPDPILPETFDWDKIKAHTNDAYFINSTKDPWGCDDKQGRLMFDHLGGTQIIRNDGHFGTMTYDQPYPTFPLLKEIVLAEQPS